jgi:hypothetical protein
VTSASTCADLGERGGSIDVAPRAFVRAGEARLPHLRNTVEQAICAPFGFMADVI